MKYNLAVCGGTFDHFHKGHRGFLRFALSKSLKLLIGLTTEAYVKENKKDETIDSYQIRKRHLEQFLKKEKALEKVSILPIDDSFIPKVWQSLPIEAIIASENTLSGAKDVNLKRKEQGRYPLEIEVYTLVKSEDNGYISSSKIRKGVISIEGKKYINPLWLKQKLFITDKLRQELKTPLGELIKNEILHYAQAMALEPGSRDDKKHYLITVGDVTTKAFNNLSVGQNISVVDFKVSRKKQFENLKELGFSGGEKVFRVNNPAGCLTPALFKTILKIFESKKNDQRIILQIEGEEDLSVLPLILVAPLSSLIFYGQPGEGLIKVEVSEKTKNFAYNLVDQFERLY